MRRFVLAIALALTGCFGGPVAFSAADHVAVVAPGTYHARFLSQAAFPPNDDWVVLTRRRGGGLEMQDLERTVALVTVPADPALPGRYIVQAQSGRGATYALLDARGGRLRLAMPPCDEAMRDAVRASGGMASFDPQGGGSCDWRDRAAMLAALKRWARTEPAAEMELVRE